MRKQKCRFVKLDVQGHTTSEYESETTKLFELLFRSM